MKLDLNKNEILTEKWSAFLITEKNKFNGYLYVTNQRLLYDVKMDASFWGTINLTTVKNNDGFIEIDKGQIKSVEIQNSFLNKKFILHCNDGSSLTFGRGAMSVEPIVQAINQ